MVNPKDSVERNRCLKKEIDTIRRFIGAQVDLRLDLNFIFLD